MYDCNLIKSRAQRMQEYHLPSLEPAPSTMQMPSVPRMPGIPSVPEMPGMPAPAVPEMPGMPAAPGTPAAPSIPPAPPESERSLPLSPLLPRVLPNSPNIAVPANPLLPPEYASLLDYESLQYLNGYLRTQIGSLVEVTFLVGSTNISTRAGRLKGVGLNYILIEDPATGDAIACDFYNIKFFRTHASGNGAIGRNAASKSAISGRDTVSGKSAVSGRGTASSKAGR